MKRLVLVLVLALACAACSPIADRCKDGTLLVAVTLDDVSAAADSFDVSLSIDGAPSMSSTVAHTVGAASGNLLVTFPHGYPRGHSVTVALDALVAGAVVGSGSATQPLTGGCEVAPLQVTAASVEDLGTDDAGADMAQTVADLTMPPPPADMVCVPSAGSESGDGCFDGIDNDCDGHTDCDDPDCTMAQCVPAPSAGFALGITVLQSSFCPGMFTSQEVINSVLTAASPDCPAGACTCTGQMSCNGTIDSYSADGSCGGDNDTPSSNAQCRNWNVNTSTKSIRTEAIGNNGGMCAKGGSSTRSTVSWSTSDRFCKTTAMGGGCPAGNVCVPKLAVQTCELADGAVACDSGYTASAAQWFHDFSDGRSCTCNCGSATGGSCGNTYAIYSSNDCSGTALVMIGPNSACTNEPGGANFHSTRIINGTDPTCGAATATVAGTLAGTGPKTLCCRP